MVGPRAACMLLLLLLPTTVSAQYDFRGCKIDDEGIDCREQGGSTEAEKKESFWTSSVAQAFYAIIGLGATGGAAFFGWTRVRRGRRTLHQMLRDIEETYATCKNEPLAGIERLNGIRAELTTRHRHGHVDDGHFLELDRKIADHTARLRVIDIEGRFPTLPADLLNEIRHLAQDGHFSDADKVRIEKRAMVLRLPVAQRRDLTQYLQVWAEADPRRQAAKAAPVVLPVTSRP